MLDEQPHEPLGVEDEFVPAGLLVPRGRRRGEQGGSALAASAAPRDGPHLMIVCMPRTCGVLLRTLRVLGRGWHWCAEASAALRTEWAVEKGLSSPRAPSSHSRPCAGPVWWAVQGGASLWLIWREGPPLQEQRLKDTVEGRAADH